MPKTADLPLAAQIMRSAREQYEKHDGLAIALAQAGVVSPGTGLPYTDSQVSKWLKGQIEPPFEVILAAARLANFSIDRYLFPQEAGETDRKAEKRLEAAIEELREENRRGIEELRKGLMRELEHLHEEMRNESQKMRASAAARAKLDEGQSPD